MGVLCAMCLIMSCLPCDDLIVPRKEFPLYLGILSFIGYSGDQPTMSFRKAVIAAISSISDRRFGVNELRDICEHSYPSMTKKRMDVNVYNYIWSFKQKGYLKCHVDDDDGRKNLYQLTQLGFRELGIDSQSVPDTFQKAEVKMPDIKKALLRRLSDYSTELAAHSAEAQEYQELSNKFPQLNSKLQRKFQEAKESALRLQGRVTALESVIKELGL